MKFNDTSSDSHSIDPRKNTFIMLDYYQRPFQLLHEQYVKMYPDIKKPHPIRARFWQIIPQGKYSSNDCRKFLNSYLISLESELANIISRFSLAYCLHVYRRLSPGPIGLDDQPATIGLTRAVLESAFQKYASFQLCTKIATSSSTPIDKVLGGLLMSPEFDVERKFISEHDQLVLTDFTIVDLNDFYDLEKLSYEIWRTTAALRATGKGAPLVVCDPPICYSDDRSPELEFLVTNYDQRNLKAASSVSESASGVTYPSSRTLLSSGWVFLPAYNLGGVTSTDLQPLLSELFKTKIVSEVTYNFAWFPFNIGEYRKAHLPFAEAFKHKYNVTFDSVLAVVAALAHRVFSMWTTGDKGLKFFKYWQRAYEGPCSKQFIHHEIIKFLPYACEILGINQSSISVRSIENAIKFWELNVEKRNQIDLSYSGPHYIFLPILKNHYFIDYTWIRRRLYDMFVHIWIPNQNFKGDALESLIRKGESKLPVNPCTNTKNEQRQIDYAVETGRNLLIVECKAAGRPISLERGDPHDINKRIKNVIQLGLSQVDDKARWLANYPIGNNYNVANYEYIIPVVISPFVEYIPSQDKYYWLSKELPRVLAPSELDTLLANPSSLANAYNKIPVSKT